MIRRQLHKILCQAPATSTGCILNKGAELELRGRGVCSAALMLPRGYHTPTSILLRPRWIMGIRAGKRLPIGRRMRPSIGMASARQAPELRHWADLTVIHGAFQARLPELLPANSGLKDVAELCKRDFAARPARDWNDVRDQLLLIGIEWNLDCDRLNRQSDACLRTVAAFLR